MFHISNLGSFGENVKQFADMDGFAPTEGGEPMDFNYGHDDFTSDYDENGNGYDGYAFEAWSEWVAAAEKSASTW